MTHATTCHVPLRTVTVLLALVGLLVLSTAPASAHPFIQGGGEVPVDSLASITLDLAHGCGTEAAGEGADTLEVALEVPEWLRIVEIAEHEGYEHEVEVTDGRVEVITWLEAGGAVPAPTFDLEVVAQGEPGETRYLAVFQGCAEQSYRWIGTPEEPADDPAVRVRLVDADPASPAPPEEPFVDPDAEEDPAAEEEPVAEEAEELEAEGATDPAEEVTDPADEDTTGDAAPQEVDPAEEDAEALAVAEGDDGAGAAVLLWAVLAAAVLAVLVAVVRFRSGRRGAAGHEPGDAGSSA